MNFSLDGIVFVVMVLFMVLVVCLILVKWFISVWVNFGGGISCSVVLVMRFSVFFELISSLVRL